MGRAVALWVSAESRAQVAGSSASPSVGRKVNAPDAAASSGVFPADLHGMRRRLPDEWAGFLKRHFNGDVRTIRAFFDCDERTARDWLAGRHGVNGAPLLKLIRQVPAARQYFLGDAE